MTVLETAAAAVYDEHILDVSAARVSRTKHAHEKHKCDSETGDFAELRQEVEDELYEVRHLLHSNKSFHRHCGIKPHDFFD